MPEQEELRLIVTLDDQASAALGNLRNQLDILGRTNLGEKGKQSTEAIKRGSKEAAQEVGVLTRTMQQLTPAIDAANTATRGFAGMLGAGGIGGGLVGAIALVDLGISKMATSVISLSNSARSLGMPIGQFKVLTEQMEKYGFTAEEAEATLTKAYQGITNAMRKGSAENNAILENAATPGEVFGWVEEIYDYMASGDGAKAMERASEALKQNTKRLIEQGFSPLKAAEQTRQLAELLSINEKVQDIGKMRNSNDAENKLWTDRDRRMREFNSNWRGLVNTGKEFLAIVTEELAPEFDKANKSAEEMAGHWDSVRDGVRVAIAGVKEFDEWLTKPYLKFKEMFGKKDQPETGTGAHTWLRMLDPGLADRLEAWEEGQKKLPPESRSFRPGGEPYKPEPGATFFNPLPSTKVPGMAPWDDPTKLPGGVPIQARQHGGSASSGRPYLVGERGPEMFVPHSSGNVMSGMFGNREQEENTEALKLNTDELKRLNDWLEFRAQEGGPGGPGGGGGGGGGFRFAGGGSGPGIGSGGALTDASGAATHGGGGGGGAAAAGGMQGATAPGAMAGSVAAPPGTAPLGTDAQSGKGSWYSQYQGAHSWVDKGDKPGSAALQGTPDWAQGIALPGRGTLGKWFDVQGPDGKIHRVQQTDVGPAKWTGRGIDISASAAERMGYTPKNFPTNARWSWRPATAPESVANLGSPVQQAIAYARSGQLQQTQPDASGGIPGGGGAAGATGGAVAGDTGYVGVGGYNFMGSAAARAMGMGDVTHGSAAAQQAFSTGIESGGPKTIRANKYAGADIAGFLGDLHRAGAPLKDFAGAYVNKPRQHGLGNAVDIETGFGSGPDNSRALWNWAQQHPKEFAEIQARHHMRNLDPTSGSTVKDWGHFEWTPQRRATASEMAARGAGAGTVAGAGAGTGAVGGAGVNQATPVTVVGVSPDASRTLAESNQRIATTAAQATAAAVKAGAAPEVAAAAGAAAAQAAAGGGVIDKPAGAPTTTPQATPAQQAEDAKKVQRAKEDTEIARLEEIERKSAVRRAERGMTPAQRAQARREREGDVRLRAGDEGQAPPSAGDEDEHGRQGDKLQQDAERRDAQQTVREKKIADREEKKAERSRQRIFREKYGVEIPYKKMTNQQKIDFLKRRQEREDLEAAQKKAEEEYKIAQQKESEDKLKESRKSLEDLEEEAQTKRDPEAAIDRITKESREIEDEAERNKPTKRRGAAADPVSGYSSKASKALDTAGRGLDAGVKHSVDVNGNAKLDVNVNAPAGTKAKATADGIFKKVEMTRQQQMTKADTGKPEEEE